MKGKALFPLLLLVATGAAAAEFKKVEECRPGLKVADRSGQAGTVLGVANGMCRVKRDDGTERSYLHWMLRPAGASAVPSGKLANGVYPCYHAGGYAFIDIHIDGPDSYRDKKGARGRYRLDGASRKIVFESGPLKAASAKLLPGPRIGLNMSGQDTYATTCSLKR